MRCITSKLFRIDIGLKRAYVTELIWDLSVQGYRYREPCEPIMRSSKIKASDVLHDADNNRSSFNISKELDVHESVHRDTTMKITNKMHYID